MRSNKMNATYPFKAGALRALALSLASLSTPSFAASVVVEDHVLTAARSPFNQRCISQFSGGGALGSLRIYNCINSLKASSVANVQISAGTVRTSAVIPAPIPESVERESYVISNCTSSPRREKNSYSVTFEEGSEVTTTQSVTTKANLSVKFSVLDFSTGAAREVSSSEETKRSYKKTVSRSTEIDELVQPYTSLILDIEQRLSNAYLDFDGDVRIEADLGMYGFKFSSLVPNNLLTVKGQLWNSTARSMSKSFREIKLDPATCARVGGLAAAPSAKQARAMGGARAAARPDDLRAYGRDGTPLQAQLEVVPFHAGMTIMTADVMSAVQVRTRSLGAGSCGATFRISGADTSVLAPTNEWSRWHNVAFVPGWSQLVIDGSAQCAAGMQAEVRYVKY